MRPGISPAGTVLLLTYADTISAVNSMKFPSCAFSLIELPLLRCDRPAGRDQFNCPRNRPVSRSITIFKNYYLTSQPARTTSPPNATNIGKMRPGQEKPE